MRSKLRWHRAKASRLLASTALAASLAGGGVLGVAGVAGAQTGDGGPPAESDRPPGGHGPKLDAAAQALGLSVDDLRTRLREGNTIAQVAQAQGVDVQTVIDAMVAAANAHIDQEVQEGDLTAEEANEHKANLPERITRLVNEGKPQGGGPTAADRSSRPPPRRSASARTTCVNRCGTARRSPKWPRSGTSTSRP